MPFSSPKLKSSPESESLAAISLYSSPTLQCPRTAQVYCPRHALPTLNFSQALEVRPFYPILITSSFSRAWPTCPPPCSDEDFYDMTGKPGVESRGLVNII